MDAAERLIDLIAFLLDSRVPVTVQEIRDEVAGYDKEQSEEAFSRMFERDKDELREIGVPLLVEENEQGEAAYSVDRTAYELPPIDLSYEEALALRIAATVLASDPAYPFAAEIRSALSKLATDTPLPPEAGPALVVRLSGGFDATEKSNLETLRRAIEARKRVEPYGLFNNEGRWYLAGLCSSAADVRTFRLSRIRGDVSVNRLRPRTPDYAVPEDFSLDSLVKQPYEMGDESIDVEIEFERELGPWALAHLAGLPLEERSGGRVKAKLEVRDEEAFVRWALSFGTNLTVLGPEWIRARMLERLHEIEALYGGEAS